MRLRLSPRRMAVLGLALLCAGAVVPATAVAQSDAALGCSYVMAPDQAGPIGHANMLQITVRECGYAWETFEVRLRNGASSTYTEPPVGFSCDDTGFDVVCGRSAPSTSGADLGVRPQCPRSRRLTVTLQVTDSDGRLRSGTPRSFPCAPPPVKVLAPPLRQSLATALRRGVVSRFSCTVRCSARVTLIAQTAVGEIVGKKTFRRARTAAGNGRVRVAPSWQRRWRRQRAAWVTVSVTVTANTGEQVSRGHIVRLRR